MLLPAPTDSSNQTTEYAYDGDNHVTSMEAVMPSDETSQTTEYVYGVSTGQGSNLDDNDLLAMTLYPDPTTGLPSSTAGWAFSGDSGVASNNSEYTYDDHAPQGQQAGIIQDSGSFSQSSNFAAGSYTLSFSSAQGTGTAQSFEVLVDGTSVGTFTPTTDSYESDTTSSFILAAGQHTITFEGIDPGDESGAALIDEVQVHDAGSTTATPPVLGDAGFETPLITGNPLTSDPGYRFDPTPLPAQGEGYTYDGTGEQTSYTDRNGTMHDYSYDQLGRLTDDYIAGFGANIDDTVDEIGFSYNDAGLLSQASSIGYYGTVINQIQDTYDGFGQLINEYQEHSGSEHETGTELVFQNRPHHCSVRWLALAYRRLAARLGKRGHAGHGPARLVAVLCR